MLEARIAAAQLLSIVVQDAGHELCFNYRLSWFNVSQECAKVDVFESSS